MQLPFTRDQFFDLFAAYNGALWPALVALWIASVVACVLLFSSRRPSDRWISALLVAHWLWCGLAYHVAFFTRINPAAWVFGTLFVLQAALFFWWGVVQGRLSFAPWRNAWAPVAWVLVAYSLVYPGINAVQHSSLSSIPAFGVPCPTTIFHGWRADARDATIVEAIDHSCGLVSRRRIRRVPPGCTRRLRPPNRRPGTGDLRDAEATTQNNNSDIPVTSSPSMRAPAGANLITRLL